MGFYADKNFFIRVSEGYVFNGLTVFADISFVTEDVLKEVVIATDTQLVTSVVRSRECKELVHCFIV